MWKSFEDRYGKKGIPGHLMLRRKFMQVELKVELREMENFENFLKNLKIQLDN